MTQFEAGKTYGNNFICDSGSWFYFEVVRRTEKNVWIRDLQTDKVSRRKVDIDSDGKYEMCSPFGNYSMSPILSSDRQYEVAL